MCHFRILGITVFQDEQNSVSYLLSFPFHVFFSLGLYPFAKSVPRSCHVSSFLFGPNSPFTAANPTLGEGNGTPLQYFCLENPMDGGGWWAAVHGVARVRHDWATSLSLFTFMHWRRWQPPLQCSCLENPRDGEAWWAAISGVAQSWTQLKWLSSSGSSSSSSNPTLHMTKQLSNHPSMQMLGVKNRKGIAPVPRNLQGILKHYMGFPSWCY